MRIGNAGLFAGLAASMLSSPALARNAELESFSPTSAWVFDYAEDHCAFRRNFASGDERFFLEFRQYVPGHGFDMILMSDSRSLSKRDLQFRFAPEQGVREPDNSFALDGDDGGKGLFATGYFAPYRDPDQATKEDETSPRFTAAELSSWAQDVEALEIVKGFRNGVRLEIGPLTELLEIRDHCIATLMIDWGVDPEASETLSSPAKPKNIERWSKYLSRAYPTRAQRMGTVGATRLRLTIDTQGAVSECVSLADIADKMLTDSACKELKEHGQFEPALDANGDPIVSVYIQSVSYVL